MTKTDPKEKPDSLYDHREEIALKEEMEARLTSPTLNEQEWDQERINYDSER